MVDLTLIVKQLSVNVLADRTKTWLAARFGLVTQKVTSDEAVIPSTGWAVASWFTVI